MASLYKRSGSPYWWIQYNHNGKLVRESTRERLEDELGTKRAQRMRAQKALDECLTNPNCPEEYWDHWVFPFLEDHAKNQLTLDEYKAIWTRSLSEFLHEKQILAPRQLQFAHSREYIAWRSQPSRKGFVPNINTIKSELRVLSLLMSEAVRREYVQFNPFHRLGIRTRPPKMKPEFTDDHLRLIQEQIDQEPEVGKRTFLQNSFLIARYQGCRIRETYLNPMEDVQIGAEGTSGRIHFRIKGGRDHVAPLHPKLVPMFQRLQAAGKTETYALRGVGNSSASSVWSYFFRQHGLLAKLPAGSCFHSLRVTAVTRLARDKTISMAKAMRYIGHGSEVVHRVYQRLHCDDLDDCLHALD